MLTVPGWFVLIFIAVLLGALFWAALKMVGLL